MFQIFQANWDCCNIVMNDINPVIVAPLLRIKPRACKEYCSLRVEVHGKYEPGKHLNNNAVELIVVLLIKLIISSV